MKIFLSFLQGKPDHPIPAYSFWEYYIKNGIEESGNSWVEAPAVDWAFGLVPQSKESFQRWKEDTWKKTISYLKKNRVDLFLSYLYPAQIDADSIKEIKKMGIPCVNFFCDHIREFRQIPNEFGVFDLSWVPEYQAQQMYKKQGFRYIHLPMPMWVDYKYRSVPEHESTNIAFIGSKDVQRQLFFERFVKLNSNIEIDIYGTGWEDKESSTHCFQKQSLYEKLINQKDFIRKNGIYAFKNKILYSGKQENLSLELKELVKPKPDFENYIRITRESRIVLGINRYPGYNYPIHKPNTYSRLRDIEAPMLGACYLTEFTPGLESMYEIGKEIEVFSNQEELIEKLKHLQQEPGKRKNLRMNAQQKALNTLSIPSSILKIKSSL
ncbi:glycosyltransferase [Pedobacter sp. BMA]|uniref:glycosyltransferase family protein n=1 Tax=Pedobacter sp. BMA TaxID=1663685 RepID=UPI00064A1137|nr:glycosyltransferase [Pedobacter sp. BMA]KLT66635.1 hypothetical protein AB669_05540 [Pedobacter sp. BMA]